MNKELPKVYEPQQVEERIYAMWEQGGCFNGDPDPAKKPFSIVMPPPNVSSPFCQIPQNPVVLHRFNRNHRLDLTFLFYHGDIIRSYATKGA